MAGSVLPRGLSEVVAAVRSRAEHTPPDRERVADLMRAVAIGAVVVGHWLAMVVVYQDGELAGGNALSILPWTHPLTWVFQVMPVFFFVGGFANAASLRSHRDRGGGTASWLLGRTDRLLRPATALFVVVPLAAIVAVPAGVDEQLVGTTTWLATLPLWFLLAYLAAVVLTPLTHALHRKAGLLAPAAFALLVGVGDALRLGLEVEVVGEANYLFGWLAIHQLGFCWQDRRLPAGRNGALALALIGFAALVSLTVLGPYPVRMVGTNTDPPTLALLALATAQVGVVLLVRPAAGRWLARTRPWTVVVAVNAVILTVFLWHMTAAVLAAVVLFPSGAWPQPEVGSAEWLLWRVPWLVVAGAVLIVLVAVFGRIEMGRRAAAPGEVGPAATIVMLAGLVAVLAGLLVIALAGRDYHGLGGLPPVAVITFLAGAVALRIIGARAVRRSPDRSR